MTGSRSDQRKFPDLYATNPSGKDALKNAPLAISESVLPGHHRQNLPSYALFSDFVTELHLIQIKPGKDSHSSGNQTLILPP